MEPPHAARRPHTWDRPTGPMEDPYAWLSDKDDPATIAYLEAENEYCEAWFEPFAALRETVFEEFKSRIQETDMSVPARDGEWWYLSRTVEGLSYQIHCRGRTSETAADNVILDENKEAEGLEYFSVGVAEISPSHRLLAWSMDVDGGEEFLLRVRDLDTLAELSDDLKRTSYGAAWAADERYLFYTVPDEAMRTYQVWRHRLGTAQADDELVFQEDDERFNVGVAATRSKRWIVIHSESADATEVWLIPAAEAERAPILVRARTPGHEYAVDHWGDRFVVLTNDEAEDFRVMTAPLDTPGEWTELVAHEPGRRITMIEPFAGHLVLHEWSQAIPRLRVLFRDGRERLIDMGTDPYDIELAANAEYDTNLVRFDFQSLVTPESVYDEDVVTGARTLLKQTPVPGVDLSAYVTDRTWATAPDGTKVPIDLVRRRDTLLDGTAPTLLWGYGAYEVSYAAWYAPSRVSLLDRGWVWALSHPRGGGELGRRWYLDGRLLNKKNSFTDFVACAEHLVASGVAAPDRLAIHGGSAGGLLVGAATTMRPELFAAVVAQVPFVDIVTTMSDPSLPLTVSEWEQWGDPREEPFASYMLSYSPYDNTVEAPYPAIYATAGLNDPRVSYHEAAKWVAKLRTVSTSRKPTVLKVELGAGHAGPSGRYDLWRQTAQMLTFLLTTV